MPLSDAVAGVPRRFWIELAIVVALIAGSAVWATRFWNAWTAHGGEPVFYQNYFEPAVMVACGKGFVVTRGPRPQVLDDFLNRRRDAMTCRDLPVDLPVNRDGIATGAWIYLQTTVGWAWRVLGISWSRMGPLFGLLFGIVVALAYGLYRLGMGRLVALVCTLGLATSCIHLNNLPHLRDYAKAPFTLALVLLLGIMVTQPVRRGVLLTLAVAYGAVLGIGYGFRTDFLANLPVFVIVVFAFLDGGIARNLVLKATATLVFIATFTVVSWPVASAVYRQGGCQWHVALLGLQAPFDQPLHLAPAPYDFGYAYSDVYIAQTIDGYARRMNPSSPRLAFCSHEYDVQSGRYLRAIVFSFPGDLIARAYSSVLQIAELPFLSWASPLDGWATRVFGLRQALLRPQIGWGIYLQAAALLIAAGWSLRLGFFLAFFIAYFGGYPAIQFQERHHFHLEFMTWWALGFVVHQAGVALWSLKKGGVPDVAPIARGLGRSMVVALSAAAIVAGVLATARWYQQRQATRLFEAYIAAPKVPLEAAGGLPAIDTRDWPQYVEADLNEASCRSRPAVTFRYDPDPRGGDLSRTITIPHRAQAAGLTRILLPVFEGFRGIEFSYSQPGCAAGAYRFAGPLAFPLLLGATLPPDWKALPLHQRLSDWEPDPWQPPLTPLPAFSLWTVGPGQTATVSSGGVLSVIGDRSTTGYQLTSPRIDVPVGSRVLVRTKLSVSRGRICLGALDATASKWLAPASAVRQEMSLTIDESGGFMVAVANCNPNETAAPSRFSVSSASYAVE
jgi:hypothetical protein